MTEEKRTIHIKGTGHASQIPDQVVLSLILTAQNKEYSAAVKIGSQQVEMLREAIVEAGFKADDLKTINFDVHSIYENEEYRDGSAKRYRQIFIGFECRHDLRLTFDFDNEKLNSAVDTIAASLSQPKISISFAIKDIDAFSDKILKSAARDAKRKAKILCAALGVNLGKLLEINYSWDEINIRRENILCQDTAVGEKNSFNFQPEEIKSSDTVDFLWEIE
ncbi:MAG: SIMPL domain-containing protein [Selenomonadaceae bacterium]|nr:SIMPL domain-containing protein [Selenomonadaceae bacterium]